MLFLFFVLFCFMVFLLHFAKFRYCISLVDHVNLVIIHYVMTCPDMAMALSIACVRE